MPELIRSIRGPISPYASKKNLNVIAIKKELRTQYATNLSVPFSDATPDFLTGHSKFKKSGGEGK
jgi:hypothetical protein